MLGAGAFGGFGLQLGRLLGFGACPFLCLASRRCLELGAGALGGRRALPRFLGRLSCLVRGLLTRRLGCLESDGLGRLGRRLPDDRQRRPGEGHRIVGEQTELAAPGLPARGLRKLVDERDRARILVRRSHGLHVLLQLAREPRARLVPGAKDDERLDDLAAVEIGHAHDRALGDGGMLEERALDLERADAIRGGDDHVVRPPDEPEVAVLVAHRPVAGEVPAVPEDRVGLLGRVPVAGEQRGRSPDQREVALDAVRTDVTRLVDHGDVVPGRGQAHRARPDRRAGRVGDEQRVLGLAVAVVDGQPERVLEARDHLRVQRLAGRDRVAEPREVHRTQGVELREHPILGRRLAEHRDAESLQEREPLLRVERPLVQHDLGAVRPRAEEHVPDRLRPARSGGAPDDVALVGVEPVRGLRALRPRVGMGVDDAFRILRGPGRVQDERPLAGRRVLGGRDRHVAAELLQGVVEVDDGHRRPDLVPHLLDLGLERAVGDHEPGPRVHGRGTRGRVPGACPGRERPPRRS